MVAWRDGLSWKGISISWWKLGTRDVGAAADAGQPKAYTKAKRLSILASTSREREIEEEEANSEETKNKEIEGYKSSDGDESSSYKNEVQRWWWLSVLGFGM